MSEDTRKSFVEALSRSSQVSSSATPLSDSPLFAATLNDIAPADGDTVELDKYFDERTLRTTLTRLLCAEELAAEGNEGLLGGVSEDVDDDPKVLLKAMTLGVPRRVCQYAFKKNDIVWICKVCQADETCVLCNECFQMSKHEGHEVFFYHAQAGGCCDCGDPDAWDSAGFCGNHGLDSRDPLQGLPAGLVTSAREVLGAVMKYIVETTRLVVSSYDLEAMKEQQAAKAGGVGGPRLGPGLGRGGFAGFGGLPGLAAWHSGGGERRRASGGGGGDGGGGDGGGGSGGGDGVSRARGSLLLHKDDVHAPEDIMKWLQEEAGLGMTEARDAMISSYDEGETVLVSEGPTRSWDDLIRMAMALKEKGLFVSVQSLAQRMREEKSVMLVKWLHDIAAVSDGTCRLICEQFDIALLGELMWAGARLMRRLTKALHDLYLTLMADQPFKTRIATAYVETLLPVTRDYASGMGIADYSIYTLSVQFLNRSTFVNELVRDHNLLKILSTCLITTLLPACKVRALTAGGDDDASGGVSGEAFGGNSTNGHDNGGGTSSAGNATGGGGGGGGGANGTGSSGGAGSSTGQAGVVTLDTAHMVLVYRRYMPIIADMKCVLNIEGVPRRFLGDCFHDIVRVLTLVQNMDAQTRKVHAHVEYESRDWMYAFNINISLASVFDFMVSWLREPLEESASKSKIDPPVSTVTEEMDMHDDGEEEEDGGGHTHAHGYSSRTQVGLSSASARSNSDRFDSSVSDAAYGNLRSSRGSSSMSAAGAAEQQHEQADREGDFGGAGSSMVVAADGDGGAAGAAASSGARSFASGVRRALQRVHLPLPLGLRHRDSLTINRETLHTIIGRSDTEEGERRERKMGSDVSGSSNSGLGGSTDGRNRGDRLRSSSSGTGSSSTGGNSSGSGGGAGWSPMPNPMDLYKMVLRAIRSWNTLNEGSSGGGGSSSSSNKNGLKGILPCYPQGVLELYPSPSSRSFHISLHRFFGAMLRESCKCHERMGDLWALSNYLSNYPETATALLDAALLVLELAAEIKAGMWKRNGQCMTDQLLNYSEAPFCKMFRDLDLLVIQFAALSIGPTKLVNHVLHRYSTFFWLFDEFNQAPPQPPGRFDRLPLPKIGPWASPRSRNGSGSSGDGSPNPNPTEAGSPPPPPPPPDVGIFADPNYHMEDVEAGVATAAGAGVQGVGLLGRVVGPGARLWSRRGSKRLLLDAEQQFVLGEECLLVLILLLTEMPLPPDAPVILQGSKGERLEANGRVVQLLRKELIHKLISGPCTHSELQDSCHLVSQGETISAEVLEVILDEIAVRREASSALEPGKFVLKESMYREYDPTYFHTSLHAHQQASEIRPTVKEPTPITPAPLEAHPIFQLFRISMLKDEALLRAVGQVLAQCLDKVPGRSSETLLWRALHVLTLSVHVFWGGGSPDGWSASRGRAKGAGRSGSQAEDGKPSGSPSTSPVPGQGASSHSSSGSIDMTDTQEAHMAMAAAAMTTATAVMSPKELFCSRMLRPMVRLSGAGAARAGAGEASEDNVQHVSLVSLLLDLRGSSSLVKEDAFLKAGVEWLLLRLRDMSESCRAVIPTDEHDDEDQKRNALMVKKLAARKRALDMMQQKAKSFAAQMDLMSEDEDEKDAQSMSTSGGLGSLEGPNGNGSNGTGQDATKARRIPLPECIVCREISDDALALVGFAQRSCTLSLSNSKPVRTRRLPVRAPASTSAPNAGSAPASADASSTSTPDAGSAPASADASSTSTSNAGSASTSTPASADASSTSASNAGSAPASADASSTSTSNAGSARMFAPRNLFAIFAQSREVDVEIRPFDAAKHARMHVQFCGHALHYSCFDQYFSTVVQRSESQNHVAIDTRKGEYVCPLCKSLGNVLVPYVPPEEIEEESLPKAEVEVDDESGAPPAEEERCRNMSMDVDMEDVGGGSGVTQVGGGGDAEVVEEAAGAAAAAAGAAANQSDWGDGIREVLVWEEERKKKYGAPPILAAPVKGGSKVLGVDTQYGNGNSDSYLAKLQEASQRFVQSVHEVQEVPRPVKGEPLPPICALTAYCESCAAVAYSIGCIATHEGGRLPLDVLRRRGGGDLRGSLLHLGHVVRAMQVYSSDRELRVELLPAVQAMCQSGGFVGVKGRGVLGMLDKPSICSNAFEALVVQIALLPESKAKDNAVLRKTVRSYCLLRLAQLAMAYRLRAGWPLMYAIGADAVEADEGPEVLQKQDVVDLLRVMRGMGRCVEDMEAEAGDESFRNSRLRSEAHIQVQVNVRASGAEEHDLGASEGREARLDSSPGDHHSSPLPQKDPFGGQTAKYLTAFMRSAVLLLYCCELGQNPESDNLSPINVNGGGGAASESSGGQVGVFAQAAQSPVQQEQLAQEPFALQLPENDDFDTLCDFFGFPRSTKALQADDGALALMMQWLTPGAVHPSWLKRTEWGRWYLRPLFKNAIVAMLAAIPAPEQSTGASGGAGEGGSSSGGGTPAVIGTGGARVDTAGASGTQPTQQSPRPTLQSPPTLADVAKWQTAELKDRLTDYPTPVSVDLVRLPHSYTELHASLVGRIKSEHPALCLVCGEVLNAHGSGDCTAHAASCACGIGVIFLLQECMILLLHGNRASYYPSPYVDAYGERHRSVRGRPLFLDERRYALVRNLWVKHGVAHEVVQSRSTSRHVILPGYY